MTNPKDLSIISVICRSNDLSNREIDALLNQLSSQKVRRICEAMLGRINVISLDDDGYEVLTCIQRCGDYKASRQVLEAAQERRRQREREIAREMIARCDRGEIADHAVFLFGIQGEIPVVTGFNNPNRKFAARQLLENRLRQRLGSRWREFLPRGSFCPTGANWREDGL